MSLTMKNNLRLTTVRNLPSIYPDAEFSQSSIRWLIFNANHNGFDSCIRRAGRKVLIDLDAFEDWMDNQAYAGGKNR
jgi:hypothetical protein